VFQSKWYEACRWLVFAGDLGGIVFALWRLAQTVKDRKFHLNLRTLVFLVALLGFTLYAGSIPLRDFTYASKVIENISTWMISISFHLLLYLWSIFLMQVRRSRAILVFRALIALGATVATFAFITSMVRNNMDDSPATRTLGEIIGYLLPITQTVIGATFLYYAANFFRRGREAEKISQDTMAVLTRLAQVAVIAFVGYFTVALTNLNFLVELNVNPGAMAAMTMVRLLSASVRGFAILTVMGVRASERRGSTTTSFNPASSQATARSGGTGTLAEKGGVSVGGGKDYGMGPVSSAAVPVVGWDRHGGSGGPSPV